MYLDFKILRLRNKSKIKETHEGKPPSGLRLLRRIRKMEGCKGFGRRDLLWGIHQIIPGTEEQGELEVTQRRDDQETEDS